MGDADFFRLDLFEPQPLVIRTFNDGTEQDFDTTLELFHVFEELVAFNDDANGSTTYSQISIELDRGEYFFRVSSSDAGKVIPSYSVSVSSALCLGQPVTVNLQNGDTPINGDDVILGTARITATIL